MLLLGYFETEILAFDELSSLPKWQLPVQPVTTISSKMRHLHHKYPDNKENSWDFCQNLESANWFSFALHCYGYIKCMQWIRVFRFSIYSKIAVRRCPGNKPVIVAVCFFL